MLIDKEYPATHSMSTAWYMVDDDGNVAIMEFNENGPVPVGIEDESFADNLLFGTLFFKNPVALNLTEEQYQLLMGKRLRVNPKNLQYNNLVRINIKKEDQLLEVMKELDDSNRIVCLNKDLGLYFFDIYDENIISAIINKKIVLELYERSYYNIWDIYNEKNKDYDYTYNFVQPPYYIYKQPSSSKYLQKRLHIPLNPVKEKQLPDIIREKVLRVPGKFEEIPEMQIAQLYETKGYNMSCHAKNIDGLLYDLFPIPGGRTYCLFDVECRGKVFDFDEIPADNPGISFRLSSPRFFILSPKVGESLAYDSFVGQYRKIEKYSLWFPFESDKDEERLIELCEFCQPYFIIVLNNVDIGSAVIKYLSNATECSPILIHESELKEKLSNIEEIINQPYRGKSFPITISEEEMKTLVNEGKAKLQFERNEDDIRFEDVVD